MLVFIKLFFVKNCGELMLLTIIITLWLFLLFVIGFRKRIVILRVWRIGDFLLRVIYIDVQVDVNVHVRNENIVFLFIFNFDLLVLFLGCYRLIDTLFSSISGTAHYISHRWLVVRWYSSIWHIILLCPLKSCAISLSLILLHLLRLLIEMRWPHVQSFWLNDFFKFNLRRSLS